MPDPVRAQSFSFITALVETAARPSFKTNPTIAIGDFRVSTDGGAYANLTNLPSVVPVGSPNVSINLTSTEMGGELVTVWAKDAAGAEWDEMLVEICTTTSSIDLACELINDVTSSLAVMSGSILSISSSLGTVSGTVGNTYQTLVAMSSSLDLVSASIGRIETDITFLVDIEGGRWRIDAATNQMLFYKQDGVTEVARFNLYDNSGNSTHDSPFERRRV